MGCKKWDIRKEKVVLLLSYDLLAERLNAAIATIHDAFHFEALQTFGALSLPQEKAKPIIHYGKEINRGGYGTIYKGFWNRQGFIIKEVRPEKGAKGQLGIQTEWDNSKALLGRVAEKMEHDPVLYTKLLELEPIIPVIAQTVNGALVQKIVIGQNLCEIGSRPPYGSGYPDHLGKAIKRAANFTRGLALLHHLGFVHCDIKPGNVMIDDERHLCHIIDLGAMKKFGEKIQIHSSNGGPEFIEQICVVKDHKAQRDKLTEEQEEVTKKIQSGGEPIEPLQERLRVIEEELLQIKTAIQSARKICDATARPAYDIYASVPILLTILFGKMGRKISNYLYFLQTKGSVKFPYLQNARKPGFNADQYFRCYCFDLNRIMQEHVGYSYSESAIEQLAQLLARMSALDHRERPSAIAALEALQALSVEFEMENQPLSRAVGS